MNRNGKPPRSLPSRRTPYQQGSYVVWRQSSQQTGVGFFSIVTSVLAQLDLAEQKNLVPVVDFETNYSTYQEPTEVNGTRNMWEYYFEQPAGRDLRDVEEGAERSHGTLPRGYPYDLSADNRYRELWDKYVRLNKSANLFVENSIRELSISRGTLGVHFRGGDMRTARGHKFPPTQRQVNAAIRWALENSDLNSIFLVTESDSYQRSFKKKWGKRLTASPSFRLLRKNSYALPRYPRPLHRYLLGLEALRDAIALSRCGGIVCGRSNLSEAALMLGKEELNPSIRISHGSNSGHPLIAPFLWYLKAVSPPSLGGFRPWH